MAAFDPYAAPPDFTGQKEALMRAYQQGLINLNAKKGQLFSSQGLINPGDYSTAGNSLDFANLQVDKNQEYGGYRNELRTEANMLDRGEEAGSGRGFSGGVANQASRTAQQAVASRQTQYQQGLQSQLGNLNLESGNQLNQYQAGTRQIDSNATEYGANAAMWQALNQTAAPTSYVVPGASGGGSVPLTPQAVNMANSLGYQTIKNPTNLKPVTFGAPTARGGQATKPTISGSHGLLGF